MGITKEAALFLCEARRHGISFRHTLTLGHQYLSIDKSSLARIAHQYGVPHYDQVITSDGYSDRFFQLFLDAERTTAIDASNYEGAEVIHDMNLPIYEELHQQYDVVIDGGSLEHIFNFPVAIANCMKLVKVGGYLFIFTNANNFMGHGFYQFSPELFYRVLSEKYGFKVEQMIAVEFKNVSSERGSYKPWYEVQDPDVIKHRIAVINSRPLGLIIQAQKLTHCANLFAVYPQQSDYVRTWEAAEARHGDELPQSQSQHSLKRLLRSCFNVLPPTLQEEIRIRYKNRYRTSLRNKEFFHPIDL